ncbi:uncharacterized protein [Prorops nasuta]|uniref:uncharacterized protein n=1 Tax=Prorops nasuta TaxID=863751 RepID=UPI0034CED4FA
MSSSVSSIVTKRDRDCVACRLVSGLGLIGAGIYVKSSAKKFQQSPGNSLMYLISGALILLGGARVFNLPPFHGQFNHR